MNDKIFLLCFLYLLIGSTAIGLMPDSFFSGTRPTDIEPDDLTGDIATEPASITTQMTFFGKFLRYMFVPIVISGLPAILALIIETVHLIIFIMTSIYVVKLLRGISP